MNVISHTSMSTLISFYLHNSKQLVKQVLQGRYSLLKTEGAMQKLVVVGGWGGAKYLDLPTFYCFLLDILGK